MLLGKGAKSTIIPWADAGQLSRGLTLIVGCYLRSTGKDKIKQARTKRVWWPGYTKAASGRRTGCKGSKGYDIKIRIRISVDGEVDGGCYS